VGRERSDGEEECKKSEIAVRIREWWRSVRRWGVVALVVQ